MTQQWTRTLSLTWVGFSYPHLFATLLARGKQTPEKAPGGHFYSPVPEQRQQSAAHSPPTEWAGNGISELVRPLVVQE